MAGIIESGGGDIPDTIYSALSSHLPYSLPLLRKLQFMNAPGGKPPDIYVLTSSPTCSDFAAAYLDLSRGPETELWLYSLERGQSAKNELNCEGRIIDILGRVAEIANKFPGQRQMPGVVLIGSLHGKCLMFFRKGLVRDSTDAYFKFLFRSEQLPISQPLFSHDLEWSTVNQGDIALVLLRTEVPRKESESLLLSEETTNLHEESSDSTA
jgi:hypothetical protein